MCPLDDRLIPRRPPGSTPALRSESPYLKAIVQDLLGPHALELAPLFASKQALPTQPFRTLMAPGLLDDPALNLLAWGPNQQTIVLLRSTAYVYLPSRIQTVESAHYDQFTAVSTAPVCGLVALGNSRGRVSIYDLQSLSTIRSLSTHVGRVGSIGWGNTLFTGGEDGQVYGHDLRVPKSVVFQLLGHNGQVGALEQKDDLLISGSADKTALLWDLRVGRCQLLLQQKGPLAGAFFVPWMHNQLVLADRTSSSVVKVYDYQSGQLTNELTIGSRICSMVLHKQRKEVVLGLGHPCSSIQFWELQTNSKVGQLPCHSDSVVGLALSSNEDSLCSGSADQTLRFWNIHRAKSKEEGGKVSALSKSSLR